MERIPVDEVRRNFSDVLLLVGNGKQRIVIQKDGHDHAAFIPLEDLALLENLDGDAEVAVEHVPVVEVRRHLNEDLDQVAGREERIVLIQSGKDVVALVPRRDLCVLENLDTRIDIEAAKRLLEKEIHKDSP